MSFESLLNKTCTVQLQSTAVNAQTGEKQHSWSDLASNVACRLRMRSANELLSQGSEYVKSTHVMYMKYRQLSPIEHRIVIDGDTYNIIGTSDMGSEGKYVAVYAELVR